jgi:cellulose synthase/poly-beta-1,6-N-acetylglucosamine synthase-like glycosyltransferase
LSSLLTETAYPNYRMTIVASEETVTDPPKARILTKLTADERVNLLVHPPRPFNYSWVHNWAIARTANELVCLVNDDVSVVASRWLDLMLGHILQPGVGAVGARLLYPDGTVQHCGVILGAGGVAAPLFQGLPAACVGYHGRAVLDQDLSCVTAGCMLIKRAALQEAGGFDERFAIAFNDVDLCIRLGKCGWRIVLAAGAELHHHESASLGPPDLSARRERHADERALLKERWADVLQRDPHYNPNLDLRNFGSLAFPPRASYAWRSESRACTETLA